MSDSSNAKSIELFQVARSVSKYVSHHRGFLHIPGLFFSLGRNGYRIESNEEDRKKREGVRRMG